MKNKLLLILAFILFIPTVKAEGFYSWLDHNDSLITTNNQSTIINTYNMNNLSPGSVFLNVQLDNTLNNPKDLTLATTMLGLTYVYFYKELNNQDYLDKAVLIADNLINERIFTGPYIYDQTKTLTFICPQMKMHDGVWSCETDYQEVYPGDNLLSVKLLLELYEINGNTNYRDKALEIMDTWVYIQDKYKTMQNGLVSGGLPFLLYREHLDEPFRLTWQVANDSAYAVYEGASKAFQVTGDVKYKIFMDDFFNYLINRLSNDNAVFTFEKNGTTYKLPYEFAVVENDTTIYGLNKSNQDNSLSTTNDITTDQLFYIVLGLMKYNKNLDICSDFYDTIKAIMLPNKSFWGEYDVNGNKGSHNVFVEVVNSGFYLELLKIYNAPQEEIEQVVRYLISIQLSDVHNNVNGSWRWNDAPPAEDSVNETLATAIILKELLPYVNNDGTTVFDQTSSNTHSQTDEPEQQETSEVKGVEDNSSSTNPKTDDSLYKYVFILLISITGLILSIRYKELLKSN